MHALAGQFVFTIAKRLKCGVDRTILVWICSLFTFEVGFLKISIYLAFYTHKLLFCRQVSHKTEFSIGIYGILLYISLPGG